MLYSFQSSFNARSVADLWLTSHKVAIPGISTTFFAQGEFPTFLLPAASTFWKNVMQYITIYCTICDQLNQAGYLRPGNVFERFFYSSPLKFTPPLLLTKLDFE